MRQIVKHLYKGQSLFIKQRHANNIKQGKYFYFLNHNRLDTNQNSLKNAMFFSRLIQISLNPQNTILFHYSTENNKKTSENNKNTSDTISKQTEKNKSTSENINKSAQNVKNEQNKQKTKISTCQNISQNSQKINKTNSDLQRKTINLTDSNIEKNINSKVYEQKQRNQQKAQNILQQKQKEQSKKKHQNLQKITETFLPLLPQVILYIKKQQKINNLYGIAGIIAMLCGLLGVAYSLVTSKFYKRRVALNKYCCSYDPQYKKDFYIQGSLVETDLKKYILNTYQNKIKIIGGLPGIGKTTVVNFLIQNLRSQKKQKAAVYYMNLRNLFKEMSKNQQKVKQEIQNLMDGVLKRWALKEGLQYKQIKIIIDDINELQKFKNEDYVTSILMGIESFYTKNNVDMICISSSSSFVEKIQKISSLKKAAYFFIVHHQTGQNYKKFVENVINKHCPTISQQAKKYMISQQYSLRKIVEKNKEFKTQKQQTQTQLEYLINQDNLEFVKLQKIANNAFKKFQDTQIALMLFQKILQNPQNIKKQNCNNIYKLINDTFVQSKQTPKSEDVVQILEKQNMLAYCKPRQMIYKKVLQSVYYQQKNKFKKNK